MSEEDTGSEVPSASAVVQGGGEIAYPLSRIYRLLRFTLVAVVITLVVWLLKSVLMVVFAAVLMAVILHGLGRLLQRVTGLPFWAALGVVVVAIAGLIVGFGLLAGPGLVDQAVKLRQALGTQTQGLHDRLAATSWGRALLDQVPPELQGFGLGGESGGGESGPAHPQPSPHVPAAAEGASGASAQGGGGAGGSQGGGRFSLPSGLAGSLAGLFSSVFGFFGTVVVVVIAAIYLAASPAIYGNGLLRLVAPAHRGRARTLLEAVGHALWHWSLGQALDMLVVGVLSGLGLWALGVPLALVLGVVAGLMNFVPYIGAITGAIPAVLIALSVSGTVGVETLALYCLIQFFEGNVLAPLIQRHAVHMPPGLTILSQTALGAILGVPGLIFATPITAALLAAGDTATAKLSAEVTIREPR